MRVPGAQVVGHRASVRSLATGAVAACSCGYASPPAAHVHGACLLVAMHLQHEVRSGAEVSWGDDGTAGVREPRRPRAPLGALDVDPPR